MYNDRVVVWYAEDVSVQEYYQYYFWLKHTRCMYDTLHLPFCETRECIYTQQVPMKQAVWWERLNRSWFPFLSFPFISILIKFINFSFLPQHCNGNCHHRMLVFQEIVGFFVFFSGTVSVHVLTNCMYACSKDSRTTVLSTKLGWHTDGEGEWFVIHAMIDTNNIYLWMFHHECPCMKTKSHPRIFLDGSMHECMHAPYGTMHGGRDLPRHTL